MIMKGGIVVSLYVMALAATSLAGQAQAQAAQQR